MGAGQHLKSSVQELGKNRGVIYIARVPPRMTPTKIKGAAGALADSYEVDTAAHSALGLDIFGLNDVSETEGGCTPAGGDVFDNGRRKRLECCSGLTEVTMLCPAEGDYPEHVCYLCGQPSHHPDAKFVDGKWVDGKYDKGFDIFCTYLRDSTCYLGGCYFECREGVSRRGCHEGLTGVCNCCD